MRWRATLFCNVRQKRSEAALDELRKAAVFEPTQARYAYVYAIGLNSAGRPDEALAMVNEGLRGHPTTSTCLRLLSTFGAKRGTSRPRSHTLNGWHGCGLTIRA